MTDTFDWKKATKRLRYRGTALAEGSKLTALCPHCGGYRYGYYGGRFKKCPMCGYDKQEERLFDHVRFLMVRGRAAEVTPIMKDRALRYYKLVYTGHKRS